jgi:hypothetical protein
MKNLATLFLIEKNLGKLKSDLVRFFGLEVFAVWQKFCPLKDESDGPATAEEKEDDTWGRFDGSVSAVIYGQNSIVVKHDFFVCSRVTHVGYELNTEVHTYTHMLKEHIVGHIDLVHWDQI